VGNTLYRRSYIRVLISVTLHDIKAWTACKSHCSFFLRWIYTRHGSRNYALWAVCGRFI